METYWAILEKVKGSSLRLTKYDDEIYEHLQRDFPSFDPAETIDEDKMKSKEGKERWRNFMMEYEKKVGDYNFGTMLRSNPKFEYGRDEVIFGRFPPPFPMQSRFHARTPWADGLTRRQRTVPRMQFYAVEIARNRRGLNDWIYEQAQAEREQAKKA